MTPFLLKFILCLTLLFAVYKLFFENSKMHKLNRFYLLGILVISVITPNLNMTFEHVAINNENILVDLASNTWYMYKSYFFAIYIIVALVMLYRLVNGLDKIFNKVRQYQQYDYNGSTVILIKEKQLPHSFLNYVFLNEEDYNTNKIEDELLTHEIAHIKQQHSLDIILVELFHIVFWFNPIIYFIKKAIRLNHEFLADEAVLETHEDKTKYQKILIRVSSTSQPMLTSHLNYGLTKKRFLMMTTKTSRLRTILIKCSLIPIILLALFLFSNSAQVEEHSRSEYTVEQDHHDNPEHLN